MALLPFGPIAPIPLTVFPTGALLTITPPVLLAASGGVVVVAGRGGNLIKSEAEGTAEAAEETALACRLSGAGDFPALLLGGGGSSNSKKNTSESSGWVVACSIPPLAVGNATVTIVRASTGAAAGAGSVSLRLASTPVLAALRPQAAPAGSPLLMSFKGAYFSSPLRARFEAAPSSPSELCTVEADGGGAQCFFPALPLTSGTSSLLTLSLDGGGAWMNATRLSLLSVTATTPVVLHSATPHLLPLGGVGGVLVLGTGLPWLGSPPRPGSPPPCVALRLPPRPLRQCCQMCRAK